MELISLCFLALSPMAQRVGNLPGMQEIREMWVRSLGSEDALQEGMATYSSILAWEIPWTEEPGGLQSMRSHRVRHKSATKHACILAVSLP